MKKWLAIVASFIGVYLVFLLAMMPAKTVLNLVSLPNNIQIGEVNGSIWHSQIKSIKIDRQVITHVDATLSVFSIFMFDPKFDITFGDAMVSAPEGSLTVSGLFSELRVNDGKIQLSANNLVQQLNLPLPMKAHDYIDIQLEEFIVGAPICQTLLGNINWEKASVTAMDETVPLGKLSANLTCDKGKVKLAVLESNDLGLTFTASIGKGFATSGNGYLKPNNKTPNAIKQVLPFLGKVDNQGRYRLRF